MKRIKLFIIFLVLFGCVTGLNAMRLQKSAQKSGVSLEPLQYKNVPKRVLKAYQSSRTNKPDTKKASKKNVALKPLHESFERLSLRDEENKESQEDVKSLKIIVSQETASSPQPTISSIITSVQAPIAQVIVLDEKDQETKLLQLEDALMNGNAQVVVDLLVQGVSINAVFGTENYGILHLIVQYNHFHIFQELEKLGVLQKIVNQQTSKGHTPLHFAASYNRMRITKGLLRVGADLLICNNDGWCPIHAAAARGNDDALKILVKENKISVDIKNKKNGMTALHCATEAGRYESIKILVRAGAKISAQMADKQTPIMLANHERADIDEDTDKDGYDRNTKILSFFLKQLEEPDLYS